MFGNFAYYTAKNQKVAQVQMITNISVCSYITNDGLVALIQLFNALIPLLLL